MREGVVTAITANWDLGIETAGTRLDIKIVGVTTPLERAALGQELPLYKVHGCASRPETLKVTREEVDEPMKWARAEVQHALVDGTVVFIGLGTIGAYVSEPFDELVPLWRAAGATIKVVDLELSNAWREALGDDADGVHIDADAAEFLDDLLRAIAREALGQAAQRIRDIQDEHTAWTQTMLDGIERLDEALRDATGHAVLRWMRDGVTQARDGQQFVLDHAGEQSLMALALLAGGDGGDLEIELRGPDLMVRTPRQYLEIASRPGEPLRRSSAPPASACVADASRAFTAPGDRSPSPSMGRLGLSPTLRRRSTSQRPRMRLLMSQRGSRTMFGCFGPSARSQETWQRDNSGGLRRPGALARSTGGWGLCSWDAQLEGVGDALLAETAYALVSVIDAEWESLEDRIAAAQASLTTAAAEHPSARRWDLYVVAAVPPPATPLHDTIRETVENDTRYARKFVVVDAPDRMGAKRGVRALLPLQPPADIPRVDALEAIRAGLDDEGVDAKLAEAALAAFRSRSEIDIP